MMKRMSVVLATVGLLLFAVPLEGQFIFLGAGVTLPTGDFGDFADAGWLTSGGFGVDIGDSGLAAGVEGFYGQNNEEDGDAEANPYGAMGFLLYRVGDPARVGPYLFGGAGIMGVDVSFDGESESETKFGYEFGAGLDVPFAERVGAWFEGRFMGSSVFESTNFFAILGGLSFNLGS